MGSTLKTYTVLNDETSEIEGDLCVFGPIGGGGGAVLIIIVKTRTMHRCSLVNDIPVFDWWMNVDLFFGLN